MRIDDKKLTVNQKKSYEYALAYCEHLMAMPNAIPQNLINNIRVNKRYSQGTQDTSMYLKQFDNKYAKSQGFDKYFKIEDIDVTPLGLCRLIYSSVYARLNKVNVFTTIELVDEKSRDEKMNDIYEKVAKMELRKPIQEILGYDILPDSEPQNYDEIEMYKEIGYKNSIELLLEKHISIINDQNNFKFDIEPIINDSLIVSELCGSYLFFDIDGSVIEEPLSMDELKIVGGTKRNYSDATGFIINKKFNGEDFWEFVKTEVQPDKDEYNDDEFSTFQKNEYEKICGCKDSQGNIDVKICYWSTWDSYNSKFAFDDNQNLFIRQHKGASDTSAKVHKWYMAYYVPQIKSVYKYGQMPNMTRRKVNGKWKEAYSPVSVIRGLERNLTYVNPVMSVVRKFEDMATIIWTKLQNEVARIKPTRVNIDISSAEAVVAKLKVVYPEIDITHLIHALNSGLGLMASADVDGEGVRNPKPFQTETHPMTSVAEFFGIINQCMDLCFYFSGVPRVDAGVEQNPDISNLQTKLSLTGADKAILNLFEIKDEFIRLSAEKKMNMVVRLYQSSDKIPNPYASMFDDYEVKMLADIDFLISREYNVRIEKGFTEERLAEIKRDILLLNNRYRETGGKEGISIEEMLQIEMWLQENPKLAIYKIQMLKNKKQRQSQQLAQQQMQENQNMQMQSAQQSQDNQMQLLQMQQGMKQMEYDFRFKLAQLESELKTKQLIEVKAFEYGIDKKEDTEQPQDND
jgi:hypothetical protein